MECYSRILHKQLPIDKIAYSNNYMEGSLWINVVLMIFGKTLYRPEEMIELGTFEHLWIKEQSVSFCNLYVIDYCMKLLITNDFLNEYC